MTNSTAKADIDSIFPVNIGKIQIPEETFSAVHNQIKNEIYKHIEFIKENNLLNFNENNQKQFDANNDGLTSFYGPNLLDKPEFDPIIKLIHSHLKSYFEFLSSKKINILFQNCWFTIYKKNQSIPRHTHPASQFSMVYYFEADKNCGDLVFSDPIGEFKLHFTNNQCPVDEFNFPNKYYVEPEPGLIVFFPGWMPHNSLPNKSEKDRIIFSLNFFIDKG